MTWFDAGLQDVNSLFANLMGDGNDGGVDDVGVKGVYYHDSDKVQILVIWPHFCMSLIYRRNKRK